VVCATLAFALTIESTAHAGNAETFYLGGDAALFAGAAAATTQGASATWYNPARVSFGECDDMSLGGSAYVLRAGGTPNLQADPKYLASREELSSIDLSAVPATVAMHRKIWGLHVGLGVFVPTQTTNTTRTLLRLSPADRSSQTLVAVNRQDRLSQYYAGLAVGGALRPNLWLGAAIFGFYSSFDSMTTTGVARQRLAGQIEAGSFEEQRVGSQLVVGLNLRATQKINVGFTLRSPVLQVGTTAQSTSFASATNSKEQGSEPSISFVDEPIRANALLLVPLRAEVGASIDVSQNTTIAADLKARGRLSSGGITTDVPIADIRAGLRYHAVENVWLGGGFFTDRSSAPQNSATTVFDYYGGTLGIEFGKPYRVTRADHPNASERPRLLRMATTVALSYAVGFGRVANVTFAPQGETVEIAQRGEDAISHEFVLFLGSSMGFGDL